jgi:hypothetical protein
LDRAPGVRSRRSEAGQIDLKAACIHLKLLKNCADTTPYVECRVLVVLRSSHVALHEAETGQELPFVPPSDLINASVIPDCQLDEHLVINYG